MAEPTEEEAINHFTELYKYKIEHITTEQIDVLQKEMVTETVVVVTDEDQRVVAMGSQISAKLGIPLLFRKDLTRYLENHNINKIIVLGNLDQDIGDQIIREEYNNYKQIRQYYSTLFSASRVMVFVDSMEYCPVGTYLAAYRNGKLLFDLKEYTKSKPYFAWVVQPHDFSPKKLQELYNYLDYDQDGMYESGVGIITGKNIQDANLLVARSFFYRELKFNNKYLIIRPEEKQGSKREGEGESLYFVFDGSSAAKTTIFKEFWDSSYIQITAHGTPSFLKLQDNEYLSTSNFPFVNSSLFIAEACFTGDFSSSSSLALEAIHKGVVAYVGSIKNGGVTAPYISGLPYLITTNEVPLSKLVAFHNHEISRLIEKFPRAFMIGDPMWGMFESIGNWSDDHFLLDLPHTFQENVVIPLQIDEKEYKSAVLANDMEDRGSENALVKFLNNVDKKVAFLVTDKVEGYVKFDNSFSLMAYAKEMMIYYLVGLQFLQGELLVTFSIQLSVLVCGVLIFYFMYCRGRINKERPFGLIVILILLMILLDYYVLGIKINVLKYLIYTLTFYLSVSQSKIWENIVLFNLVVSLPILVILSVLKVNIMLFINLSFTLLSLNLYLLVFLLVKLRISTKIGHK